MKHSTNYVNTFIQIAQDCELKIAKVPLKEGSIAKLEYELLIKHPYQYTSDEVKLFVQKMRKGEVDPESYFSKGQPCFRASPLTKQYGYGVHFNERGLMAIYPIESDEYKKLMIDLNLKQLFAMRSKK